MVFYITFIKCARIALEWFAFMFKVDIIYNTDFNQFKFFSACFCKEYLTFPNLLFNVNINVNLL